MSLIAAFMQRRTGEAIATASVAAKMEEQMNAIILDPVAKHTISESVSPCSRMKPAANPSLSDKEEDVNPTLVDQAPQSFPPSSLT